MSIKKGFTLIEIVVVMIIVGILAVIALPNYTTYMEDGMATAAKNNLMAIGNNQQNYYFKNGNYCVQDFGGICATLILINSALGLNLSDNNYTYACSKDPAGPSGQPGYTCTAMRFANGTQAGTSTTLYYQKYPTQASNPNCISAQNYCPNS